MSVVFEAVAKDGVIRLPNDAPPSGRCLVAIVDEDLQRLREDADAMIAEPKQRRMSELLLINRDGKLSAQEAAELDALSREFDLVTLAKGRALSILSQLGAISSTT